MKARLVWICLCVVWLLVAGAGAWALSNYENTPGGAGETPRQWPVDWKINVQPNQPVLVMFAHPQCPCTRASIGELNRLMAQCDGKMAAQVYFIQHDVLPKDWTQSALWKSAADIPGVQVHPDSDGQEARRFGAESSGYVVLYDAHGNLLFNGGITSARGHAGDNTGENVIIALLAGNKTPLKQTSVFGCELLNKPELTVSR